MPRTHAALRLLALGPLTKREFAEITGWSLYDCMKTLGWLQETDRIVFDGSWRLA